MELDSLLPANSVALENQLVRLGFENARAILTTAEWLAEKPAGARAAAILKDPSLNPNGIQFIFIVGIPKIGDPCHLYQVNASKEFRPSVRSRPSKIIEQKYAEFSGIPSKAEITQSILWELQTERNRYDLYGNQALRKQLAAMGFHWANLFADAVPVLSNNASFKGVTLLQEREAILGDRPQNPKYIHFTLQLRRRQGGDHLLESISLGLERGQPSDNTPAPFRKYTRSHGTFPSKIQMIQELAAQMTTQFANMSPAQHLLQHLGESSAKSPNPILAPFKRKKRA